MMRVYIPATFTQLEDLVSEHQFPARSGLAFTLTPALRESYAVGDEEELEHVAFLEAARASLRLLSTEEQDSETSETHNFLMRRVVISVDIPDDEITMRPDLDVSVVKLKNPMIMESSVAAVHIDLPDTESVIAKASSLIDAADLGDEDAELAVGDAEDYELAWYAPTEVRFLVELNTEE